MASQEADNEKGSSRELNLAEQLSEERYLARMAAQLPIHQDYGKYLSRVGVSQDLIDQALTAWKEDLRTEQERLDSEDPISQLQNLLGTATEGESPEGRRILEASIIDLEQSRTRIVDVREGRVNPAGNIEIRLKTLYDQKDIPSFVILGRAYSSRNPEHVKLQNKVVGMLGVLQPGETAESLGTEARTFVSGYKGTPSANVLLEGQSIRGPIFPRTGTSIDDEGFTVGPFITNIPKIEIRLAESPMLRVAINQSDITNIQPAIRK